MILISKYNFFISIVQRGNCYIVWLQIERNIILVASHPYDHLSIIFNLNDGCKGERCSYALIKHWFLSVFDFLFIWFYDFIDYCLLFCLPIGPTCSHNAYKIVSLLNLFFSNLEQIWSNISPTIFRISKIILLLFFKVIDNWG